jgi:DNA-binding NarL/FixJ family response regulator
MPMLDGIEVLKQVTPKYPDYKFLLLTQNLKEDIINNAYNFGARGFLHKTCTAEELKTTIDNIIKLGYANFAETLRIIRSFSQNINQSSTKVELNDKEFRFLELVCHDKEYTYNEMADIMGVSVKTIDKYRANLFVKLNVKSKVGLVLYSFKHQLTKPFIENTKNPNP